MMETNQRIKSNLNTIILCSLAGAFASCGSIKVNTPTARFVSPEAQGKLFSGSGRIEQQSGTEGSLDFENDKTNNPLELRNNVTSLTSSIDLGLTKDLDFLIKGGGTTGPSIYTFKYQILGESRKKADKGNKSLAISVGYGMGLSESTDSDDDLFSSSADDITAEIEQAKLELSLIYGYRPEPDTLVYTSIQAQKVDLNFELSSTKNANLDGEEFSLNTWTYGASLGAIRYFDKFYANVEVSAQSTDWTNNDPMTYAFLNLALGYRWE